MVWFSDLGKRTNIVLGPSHCAKCRSIANPCDELHNAHLSVLATLVLALEGALLNLVDAVSTALFLLLLGVSLHFAPVSDSREFMDACGALAYFLSLGVIAMVALVSFGLFAVERCSAKAKRKVSSHSALANLGKLPSSEEMVKALQAIGESLGKATDAERQLLVKKMSSLLSVYDINIVGQALLILSIDCELQSSSFRWHLSTRIRAKRVSQMTREIFGLSSW